MEGSTLIVEGRHIPNLAFDLDRSCYYISEWDVPAFLGHGEMDYKDRDHKSKNMIILNI